MADASERIVILSAIILLFIALQSNSDLTGKRIGTLNDIEVDIHTSQDEYVLGEKFTATVYLVNNDSHDIWIEALYSYTIDANSLNDPEPVLQINHVSFADKNPLIHIPANSSVTFETIHCISKYTGEYQIMCIGGKKTVLIHMREYYELWEGELEVADPRFLAIDKNESLDMSAFRGLSSKLRALVAKGVPEIKDSYVYHSMDWQNGTAYIVLEDTSENVTRFILDQFSPPVREKIRFLKSPAPLSQISEWRETLMELCLGRLKERGVNWTAMGTYYDGRIRLDVEEITPETIDIIEEVIEGRVPPGIFVIWESDPMIELNEQDIDSIESSAEGTSAIQIGRGFLDGKGFKTGELLCITLEEKEPNFYWDYALKFERPDLTGLRTCWVIRFEQKQRPGHFFEVWIDASENIVIGGSQCR